MTEPHDRYSTGWPRSRELLPLLALFSGTTLLALFVLTLLCWRTLDNPTDSLHFLALGSAAALALFAIVANLAVWLLALYWGREAVPMRSQFPTVIPPAATVSAAEKNGVLASGRPLPVTADVVIDQALWTELKAYLEQYPRQEQGGFVLGHRAGGRTYLSAVIFPRQVKACSTFCEFPTEDISIVREACDQVENLEGAERLSTVVAWIHTHPHLSVFLSGTDKDTLKQWQGIDPRTRLSSSMSSRAVSRSNSASSTAPVGRSTPRRCRRRCRPSCAKRSSVICVAPTRPTSERRQPSSWRRPRWP